MLVAIPTGGLANRLRMLASASRMANSLDLPFRILWEENRACGCPLDKLFSNYWPLITESQLRDLPSVSSYSDYRDKDGSYRMVLNSIQRPVSNTNIVIKSCWFVAFDYEAVEDSEHLLPDGFKMEMVDYFSRLRPVGLVSEQVDKLSARFNEYTVGVHIRRTDHTDARRLSTDEKFKEKMLGILAEEPKTKFFLATDCPKTEELFTKMFCERVMKYDKRVCRNVTSRLAKDRARV